MSDERPDRNAEFALGLMTAAKRDAVARAAETDSVLSGEIAAWNECLNGLNGDEQVAPPSDMFGRIQSAIQSRSQRLPGTMTVRANDGVWETVAPGVERKKLWDAGPLGRVSILLRCAPGAFYDAHDHDDDEECYVISGDITFDTLTLRAGDYHLARRGVPHPPARSQGGCMLLITTAA
jgi:anti-sigma factor ChrR (cupin superfamily)